ncbi:MAG: YncE family protein [Acidobacteriaceae bacterium]
MIPVRLRPLFLAVPCLPAFVLAVLGLALAAAPTLSAQSSSAAGHSGGPYRILSVHKLGGPGGWDYLAANASTRELYVARSGPQGQLHVYNLDTLAPITTIPLGTAHGAAIDNATHHGFATGSQVTMFDSLTHQILKTIATGGRPDGYLDDPITHHVYIFSHAEPNVTVLDAATGDILGTVNLGGEPEQSQLDGQGHLFLDVENKDRIAVVDTRTLTLTGNYDISSVDGGCSGLAIDADHGVLFAACNDKNNMVILRASDGHILTTLPIGVGCDGALFNPATQEVYSTQADGTLTIIKERLTPGATPSASNFSVEQTLKTQRGARTITFDPNTGRIFTATADFAPQPAAQPVHHHHRPLVPGSFRLLVIGR